MQILRKPPYPISISYTVPDSNTDYVIVIKDSDVEDIILQDTAESSASSVITYSLPEEFSKYDSSYSLSIYEAIYATGVEDPTLGDLVVEDNLDITRPYVDPSSLGTTASEIAEYTKYERLARTIIDSITGGFYYSTEWLEVVGQGTDYMPVWEKVYKVLKVYENQVLVWDTEDVNGPALADFSYMVSKDLSAIIKDPVQSVGEYNRADQRPANIPFAPSDSIGLFDTEDSGNFQTFPVGVTFPQGWDYIFFLESGYKVVPYDIQDATKMLIEDIKCGRLDYYKRYILNYSTDQYRVQIDKGALQGTGNMLVDKILDKYVVQMFKPEVL